MIDLIDPRDADWYVRHGDPSCNNAEQCIEHIIEWMRIGEEVVLRPLVELGQITVEKTGDGRYIIHGITGSVKNETERTILSDTGRDSAGNIEDTESVDRSGLCGASRVDYRERRTVD